MDPKIYSLIHVLSIMLLTGSIFSIAANPQPHKKKKMMMITGVLSLLALVGGFGLIAKNHYSYTEGWIIVKAVVWLFLSALAGLAFKKSKSFVVTALVASMGIALFMVYFRPF